MRYSIQNKTTRAFASQQGFGIMSVLLALLVGSVATHQVVQNMKFRAQQGLGSEITKRGVPFRIAMNTYISENYHQLQNNEPVAKHGVTLQPGEEVGGTMSPRVEDLIAMRYLPQGFSANIPVFGSDAYFAVKLRREPLGCVAENCEIPGFAYLTKPALQANSEANAVLIGQYRVEVGPDALISSNINPSKLVSGQGMEVENPLSGQPPGVLGILVGWGSSTYGNWLTINDTRDPNFRGTLTVKGKIESETSVIAPDIYGSESVGAGKGDGDNCNLAELSKTGEIFSRVSNCLAKVVVSPVKALISTYYNDGVKSIEISGEDGLITVNDRLGKTTISMSGNTSELLIASATDGKTISANASIGEFKINNGTADVVTINASGDVLVAAAGSTAGMKTSDGSGRVYGDVLRTAKAFAPRASCMTPNVEDDIANNLLGSGLVICKGGVWVALTGVVGVTEGDTCSPNGQLGSSDAGNALLCSGGKWVDLSERFGKRILVGTYLVSNGSTVAKPACVSGTVGTAIYVVPKNIDTSVEAANFAAIDYGSTWRVVIQNNLSAGMPGEGIAMIYCIY